MPQAALGHEATFADGIEQNFVYIVFVVTRRSVTLKPSFSNCSLAIWADRRRRALVGGHHQELLVALVLAGGVAGLLHVLGGELRRSACRPALRKSTPVPSMPPASSKPAIVGGR